MTHPIPLTEGRLMLHLNNIIDTVAPSHEAMTGYSEQTLARIQEMISRYFDRERAAIITAQQEQREQIKP